MTIEVGDALPNATFTVLGKTGPEDISTADVFRGKRVLALGLPGAFTRTCSSVHLPGFVAKAQQIKAMGVDTIACIAVNDAFVMAAWQKAQQADEILMLADGNAEFTRAIGLTIDLSSRGMGLRSQRYVMLVEDGVLRLLDIDPPGVCQVSSAESVLARI